MSLQTMRQDLLALDRATLRTFDQDGHLRVERTPISKANVCDYLGSEIPQWRRLGLEPNRRYAMLRCPEELAKAAATFHGKPLLFDHNPIHADAHDHARTVGSVWNAEFQDPFMYSALSCWSGPAIRAIEDDSQKQISASYHYDADMTPGVFRGVAYDGVMRNIRCNHVSLVPKGRAGPDVVVCDSYRGFVMPKRILSPVAALVQGALMAHYGSKLAMDGGVDLGPAVSGVTPKNFKATMPAVILGSMKALRGKLAQDAELEDVAEVIEALAPIIEALEEPVAAADPVDDPEAKDAGDAELRAMLKAKGLSDEEIDRICGMSGAPVIDEKDDDKDKKAMDAAIRTAVAAALKGTVSKPAMDAAIAEATERVRTETATRLAAIDDARRFVRPWVGELPMAFDSAEAVERQALTVLGKAHAGKHPDSLRDIIEACPKPGDAPRTKPRPAMDAAGAQSFAERFGIARIGRAA
ncbi:DUF2213 domain-containing protein [Methylobacterium currus]|uniref:DUF2213 domain-containing protein n=2 Tax=Methylobacterium currus TaxID=2051553 RepID=A0A2R4WI65_9HYPH|nr:DUF2213 domain-containing protein [Methylobacterium currus]